MTVVVGVNFCLLDKSHPTRGATLGEVIVGLGLFSLLTLAVVGVLVQTAYLDTRDTEITETTSLADSLMERRVSAARVYESYDALQSTPAGDYWTLDAGRADGLDGRYIYRVEVTETVPAMKKISVSVYHRDPQATPPAPDTRKPRDGRAVTVGTVVVEPAR